MLGQTFYGLWEDQNTQIYSLVSVDAATTALTSVGPIPGLVGYVAPGTSTINTSTNEYIFRGFDGNATRLYSMDLSTGSVNSSPVLNGIVVGLEYSCITDTIYALHEDSAGLYHFAYLNGSTVVTVNSIPGLSAYVGGTFTLDALTGRYHFVGLDGPDFKLYTIDIHTGNVLASPNFPDNVHAMRYSCATDSIYGRWEDQNTGTYYLVSVDPLTGSYSPIGPMSGTVSGNIADAMALDAASGHYTFLGFTGAPVHLITVKVNTASVTYSQGVSYTNLTGLEAVNCCPAQPLNPPVANFSTSYTDTLCVGDSIILTDLSTNSTTRTWSVPGGTPSGSLSDSVLTVLYDSAGVWHVGVTAVGPDGSDDTTATALIVVSTCDTTPPPDPPTVSVQPTSITACAGDSLVFTATVTNTTSLSWAFTGGQVVGPVSSNPITVYFPNAGTYGYTVTANGLGGTAVVSATNTVSIDPCFPEPPVIVVQHNYADSICMGDTITYNDLSLNRNTLTWTFAGGDPLSSTDSVVSVVYNAPGTFDVDLVIGGPDGTADTTFSVLVVDCSVGLDEFGQGQQQEWRVWPNPSSGDVWLQAHTARAGARYELYSTMGSMLSAGTLPAAGAVRLPLAGFRAGLYLLRVYDHTSSTLIRVLHR